MRTAFFVFRLVISIAEFYFTAELYMYKGKGIYIYIYQAQNDIYNLVYNFV